MSTQTSHPSDIRADSLPPDQSSGAPTRRVARNLLLTFGTQIITAGLSLIVTLYLPRAIELQGTGIVTTAGALSGVLSVLVSLGTSKVLTREIARDRAQLGSAVAAAIGMRLVLGALALCLGWLLLPHTNDESSKWLIFLGLVGMPIAQIVDVLVCALTGLEDFARLSAIGLVDKIFTSVALITLAKIYLERHASSPPKVPLLWAVFLVGIVSITITLILYSLAIRHHLRCRDAVPRWKIDRAQIRFLLRAGLPFLMSDAFMSIYGQCDVLLFPILLLPAQLPLQHIQPSLQAAGWYGITQRLGNSALIIPTLLCSTMLPTIIRLYTDDYDKFAQFVRRLFSLMILTSVPVAGLLVFAPDLILHLFRYPPDFAGSIWVIKVWGSGIIFWYLSQAAATVLIASNRQAVFGKVTGVAALVTVPLCAVGILLTAQNKFNGAMATAFNHFATALAAATHNKINGAFGATVSDVLVEAGIAIAYIRCMPAGLVNRDLIGVLARTMLAAVPLAVLSWMTHGDPLRAYLPVVGLLLYVPLCFLMGCIGPKDLEIVRDIFRRRTGGN